MSYALRATRATIKGAKAAASAIIRASEALHIKNLQRFVVSQDNKAERAAARIDKVAEALIDTRTALRMALARAEDQAADKVVALSNTMTDAERNADAAVAEINTFFNKE